MLSSSVQNQKWNKHKTITIVLVALAVCGVVVMKAPHSNVQSANQKRIRLINTYECPPGTWTSATTAAGCTCDKCPVGNKCVGGANAVKEQCPPGTYQDTTGQANCKDATLGHFAQGPGATSQTPCPVGTYADQLGSSACIPAAIGSFAATTGSATDAVCPLGQYTPRTGMSQCLPCDPGHKCSPANSGQQVPCAVGEYQPQAGQSACLPASPGHYVDTTGATAERPCAQGSFAAGTGTIVCTPAPPGHVVSSEGSTSPTQCGLNTYQPCEGQATCLNCPSHLGSGIGATQCTESGPVTCIPAGPRGGSMNVYGSVPIPKAGPLTGITLTYVSGRMEFLPGTTLGGYWGFTYGVQRGYQVYLTDAGRGVMFPNNGTNVFSVRTDTGLYQITSGPLATVNTNWDTGRQLVMEFDTRNVTVGEILRLYTGQNLFNMRWALDDHGETCATITYFYNGTAFA